jgi:hypothetical protein
MLRQQIDHARLYVLDRHQTSQRLSSVNIVSSLQSEQVHTYHGPIQQLFADREERDSSQEERRQETRAHVNDNCEINQFTVHKELEEVDLT